MRQIESFCAAWSLCEGYHMSFRVYVVTIETVPFYF